jgi:DNA repair photolyase
MRNALCNLLFLIKYLRSLSPCIVHIRFTKTTFAVTIGCMDAPEVRSIEAKTGVSRSLFAEPFLVSLYRALAPYRGCSHACCYCDGRAEKYYVEGDFGRDIAARTNLPELVTADVKSGRMAKEWGAVCIGSGVTDVYQPLEEKLRLTRRTLEALVPAQVPVVILTKNILILRDFDVLLRFPKALIILTITSVDPKIAKILEPGASAPEERLEVVRRAKASGFMSGIMAMPLCPGISDTAEQTNALFESGSEAGADFIYPGGLTLRPGRQKDLFMTIVGDSFSEHRSLYERIYSENRQSGMPIASYAAQLMKDQNAELVNRHMPQMIPHNVYRELLSPPDSLFVLFCHMQDLYRQRGIDIGPLKKAAGMYAEWLRVELSALRRKRFRSTAADPFPITRILSEKLIRLCSPDKSGESDFTRICGNERLARFVQEIILEKKYFDYSSLSLA